MPTLKKVASREKICWWKTGFSDILKLKATQIEKTTYRSNRSYHDGKVLLNYDQVVMLLIYV
jgi:hypothetical protein